MESNCTLVVGGKWHDFGFARLELCKLLGEDADCRVRVVEDYEDLDFGAPNSFLVSYTCDVVPSLGVQERLRDWVSSGGRWLALHGTNSILRFGEDGKVDAPDWAPLFMETLGTAFVAHPPIAPFTVEVTAPDHPLVACIEPFETDDELYLSRQTAEIETLMHVDFEGEAPAFVQSRWEHGRHPLVYLCPLGDGAVLYNALGHCRGHADMRPRLDHFPAIQRGSWSVPQYYELLRRGIAWAKGAA